jgi:hypothetical protein
MNTRRPLALFAALALLSPLAAVAVPACGPSEHCPMAGLVADDQPCHGAAIQADDCCLTSATGEPAGVLPVIGATASVTADATLVPHLESGDGCPVVARVEPPSTPLYRLFRALLI